MLRAICIPLLFLLVGCGSEDPFAAPDLPDDVGVAGDGQLAEALEPIRAAFDVPALGAILIHQGQIVETAAVGRRSLGSATQVTTGDQWHVGSLTKAMTATLAAVLVEEGHLDWTTTIAEGLPGIAPLILSGFEDITLEELLSHTSGLTNDLVSTAWWDNLPHSDDLPDQRLALSVELLQTPPAGPRGEYLYSNGGYVVAGAMLERVMGEAWEDLIASRLFAPLGMTSAGFGAPGSPGSLTEPWGHSLDAGSYAPVEPGPAADNPPAIGPAGTVHLSMADYAKFMAQHIAGERGVDGLVSAETFTRLHRQALGTAYGLGWAVTVRDWADGVALYHEGSNLLWYANVWLAPERDMGMLVVTNAGGDRAFRATDAAIDALIGRFEAAQAPLVEEARTGRQ
ncbi:MAG: serine hydrolase domain-containing protein [Candidatus Palauibacterales bacterium]|nr:serine hydrolase domain-containing protein [Candidatus Palauibacterales bacterium]MDP2482939.1 serine hydrolase domain-containing protein [Candidatus Palauibacterales bacterium]